MMAAAFNRVEMVTWLLAHGASPDARDASGSRAIDVARATNANDVGALLSGKMPDRRLPASGWLESAVRFPAGRIQYKARKHHTIVGCVFGRQSDQQAFLNS